MNIIDHFEITTGLQLCEDAANTAHFYLQRIAGDVDQVFGAGYAAQHPELVAAMLSTACQSFADGVRIAIAKYQRENAAINF